jgi:hypothetical protein
MKKDLVIHFSYLVVLFVLVSLVKRWFAFSYAPFWLGGILGTILPDIDHLLYVYIIKPDSPSSARVISQMTKGNLLKNLDYLASTRHERTGLVFHTALFQIIFILFAFLVVTSSGSLFGTGIVLAFSLHLIIDQVIDIMDRGTISHWFANIAFKLDKRQERWFIGVNALTLLLLGFYFN